MKDHRILITYLALKGLKGENTLSLQEVTFNDNKDVVDSISNCGFDSKEHIVGKSEYYEFLIKLEGAKKVLDGFNPALENSRFYDSKDEILNWGIYKKATELALEYDRNNSKMLVV